ncbi:MAG: patatin-like phospholipase family protein [Rhizobiaceae bacterium]
MRVLKTNAARLTGILSLFLLVACVTPRISLPEEVQKQARVANFEKTLIRIWGDATDEEVDQERIRTAPPLKIVVDKKTGIKRQDFLVLSGGGAKGAYGAGLLNGWTESGNRPEFSIVTGVSTGAIIAPFAFMGPKYDRFLTEFYTTYSTKDLVRPIGLGSILGGVLGGSSVADPKPLTKLIARYITPQFLREIAAEHASGRYLLIGTTNLDAQRPVIWNMGEIAKRGDDKALALFRSIILASTSIPGAFPPVLIDVAAAGEVGQELHVDGGTTDNAILVPIHLKLKDTENERNQKIARRLFVVVNSNLAPKRKVIKASTISIATRSIDTLIKQQTAGDVLRLYGYSKVNKIEFNYTEIPDSFDKKPTELFDKEYMRALYNIGELAGKNDVIWRSVPRGL